MGRALRQYNIANGALLAGGITYKAIFSLFAALTIGFTVFVRVLGNDEELRQSVIEAINNFVPGLITTEGAPGILSVDSLIMSSTMNLTSVIAGLVLLWSVMTGMESVRSSVRAMFSLPPAGSKAFSAKLRSLLGFISVALALMLSAAVGVIASYINEFLENIVHLGDLNVVFLQVMSFALTFLFDAIVFALVIRVLAGIKISRRDMIYGALISAGGFAVIRYLGTSVVAKSATNNPLFATGAVLVTVLVWLYLCARIILTAAAFAANTPGALLDRMEDEQNAKQRVQAFSGDDVPEVVFVKPGGDVGVLDPGQRSKAGVFIAAGVSLLLGILIGKKK